MTSNRQQTFPDIEGFDVVREVGRGGFAVVYAARQSSLNREVAVKVIHLSGTDQRRFVRECLALGPLTDVAGVVSVLDATQTRDGLPCIVMPLMTGRSLADQLDDGEVFEVPTVVQWGVEMATALARAHALGIYHRDVKPANVLMGRTGNIALSDFGIASIQSMANASQTVASLSPPYAPPERFQHTSGDDPVKSDVYSLGATLYALLTGDPPFGTAEDGGLGPLVNRVCTAELPPISRPDVTAPLFAALERATAKDPADRYRDCSEFAAALAAILTPLAGPPLGGPADDPPAETGYASNPTVIRSTGGRGGGSTTVGQQPISPHETLDHDRRFDATINATMVQRRLAIDGHGESTAPGDDDRPRTRALLTGGVAAALVVVLVGVGFFLFGGDSSDSDPASETTVPLTGPQSGVARSADLSLIPLPGFTLRRDREREAEVLSGKAGFDTSPFNDVAVYEVAGGPSDGCFVISGALRRPTPPKSEFYPSDDRYFAEIVEEGSGLELTLECISEASTRALGDALVAAT